MEILPHAMLTISGANKWRLTHFLRLCLLWVAEMEICPSCQLEITVVLHTYLAPRAVPGGD
jgi:hypothetical protein